jgi:hypothetical protein
MFRLVLLVACPEEKVITVCKRLLGAVKLSAQTRAVIALVGSIDHGLVKQRGQHRHTVFQAFVVVLQSSVLRTSIA